LGIKIYPDSVVAPHVYINATSGWRTTGWYRDVAMIYINKATESATSQRGGIEVTMIGCGIKM
jgi:hypothetical protein